jgi:hypothetical protein
MQTGNSGILNDERDEQWNITRPEFQAFETFAGLAAERRELKRRLDEVKARMDAMESQLKDLLGAEGYERVRVGGFTIYLKREIWARAKTGYDTQDVCSALKRAGLGHFVRDSYNVNQLSGHVRRLEEAHLDEIKEGQIVSVSELLPKALAQVLNVEPSWSVIATPGSGS